MAGDTRYAITKELRLPVLRADSARLAGLAQRSQLSYLGFLAEVLPAEVVQRSPEAHFPRLKRLADFDLSVAPTQQSPGRPAEKTGGEPPSTSAALGQGSHAPVQPPGASSRRRSRRSSARATDCPAAAPARARPYASPG